MNDSDDPPRTDINRYQELDMRFAPSIVLGIGLELLALSAPAFAGELWTVGPLATDDFIAISQAVAAAAEGDTILVRGGNQSGFSISGKSLAIHADTAADVRVLEPISISDLNPLQSVRISGLTFPLIGTFLPTRVVVRDCRGMVWLQDCAIQVASPGSSAVRIEASGQVVVENCSVLGSFATGAVDVERSHVEIFQSHLEGGYGFDGNEGFPAGKGLPGLQLLDSTAWVDGSTLVGGLGGETGPSHPGGACTKPGGEGGPGIALEASEAVLHEVVLTPGVGGVPIPYQHPCTGGVGATGPESVVTSGILSSTTGVARVLSIPATVREGDAYELLFEGDPEDVAWLALSLGADIETSSVALGTLLVAAPIQLLFAGHLNAAGERHVPVVLDDLFFEPTSIYFQGLFFRPSEGFVLSSARGVLHLDASVP